MTKHQNVFKYMPAYMPRLSSFFGGLLSLAYLPHSQSHTDEREIETRLSGHAAITWRSNEEVNPSEPYLIPGALMGGEALGQTKGVTLDEARLMGTYVTSENYYVKASLTSHHEGQAELENFSLVAPSVSFLANSNIELGRFDTKVTPTASWHSASSEFSESSLLSDVFFGRHFIDTGLRIEKKTRGVSFGIEGFNGNNWPSSNGEGSATAFLQMQNNVGKLQFSVNTWAMYSEALNRSDNRYTSGHSHGGNQITSNVDSYSFTGDIKQYGVWLNASIGFSSIVITSEIEWIQSESNGTIENSTQQSMYENQYDGYRLYFSTAYKKHTFSIQHEEIALQNDFFSPITVNFAENANLVNNGFEPSKTVAAWSYSPNSDLSFRLEQAELNINATTTENRTSIGVVWNKELLN